jgi:hypothetical protein
MISKTVSATIIVWVIRFKGVLLIFIMRTIQETKNIPINAPAKLELPKVPRTLLLGLFQLNISNPKRVSVK